LARLLIGYLQLFFKLLYNYTMGKFSFKIAFSIITAGFFIVVSFAALNYENLNASFYIVSGFLVIFILLFGIAMGRIYALPFKELLEKADNVNKGDLKSRVHLKTKDEVEELSRAFNKIAEGLEKSTSDIETIKRSSDIKFKTKDIVSEKVIDALEEKIKNRTLDLEKVMRESEQLREQIKSKDREILSIASKKRKK